MPRPTLEFHRPSRDWLQVRCSCGNWSKDPVHAWASRSKRPGFDYHCGNSLHILDATEAARLRELIEHPGWD